MVPRSRRPEKDCPVPEREITVHYFALLREQRGLEKETVRTAAAEPRALFAELRQRHGFTIAEDRLWVAVNDELRGWDHPLQPGDKVVFIPPIAGG